MKKRLIKIWGIGLTTVLLVSMLLAAAPVSSGTLGFSATTDIPDGTNKMIITADSGIVDIAVAAGGERIYAATRVQKNETATATVTTAFVDGGDGLVETYSVTYTNQDGVVGRAGSVVIPVGAALAATVAVTLATGDTGMQDITAMAITTGDATAGVISIAGDTSAAVLVTSFTFAAVFTDGAVVTAGTNAANAFYKSSDGGTSWAAVTLPTAYTGAVNMVAVAPDDEDLIVIAGNTVGLTDNKLVYVSTDAGANWGDSLGTVQSATGTVAATQLNDLAVSALTGTTRYIALAGKSAAGPGAYYFNLGANAPVWKNAVITGDFTTGYGGAAVATEEFHAVAFSPNFASDMVMLVVGDSQNAVLDPIEMHIASFNQKKWDAAIGTFSGPVTIKTPTAAATLTITKADIAVDPEYLGGDDTMRTVFVGLTYVDSVTATEIGDIFRIKDATVKDLGADVQINTVAWDGTDLAAGAYLTNNVYRSADALATTPTIGTSRGYKEIGVDQTGVNDQVVVRWSGNTLVGGKIGAAAGFGKSTDNGKTWNDITLIESALTTMRDVWASPDGSIVYLLTDDGAEVSLWRKADSAWSRVFSLADTTATGYIVRAADSDPDVVYIAERLTNNMYYSTDGGTVKWTVRASKYTIQDLAVESEEVAYVGESGSAKVSKTTNGGFTWATTVSTSLGAGNIHSMTLISEDNLLVGSTLGCVSYTTDGNSSWNDLSDKVLNQALLVQVTASGLADGDYIFASTTGAIDADVERWQIGTSTDWKDMADTMSTAIVGGTGSDVLSSYGIDYQDGALYVLAADTVDGAIFRNANTAAAAPAAGDWTVAYELLDTFNNAPSALRVSSGLLWAIESTATELHTFTDTLVGVPIALVSPADGFQNPVNPVSGASQDVAFSWTKPTTGTLTYNIRIYADEACTAQLLTYVTAPTESAAPVVILGPNQAVAVAPATGTQLITFAAGQTYYWKVRASSPVLSPYSEVRSFTIQPLAAQVPAVLSPANGTDEASPRPSFSWAPVAGASNYQFQLALNPYINAPIVDVNIASTAYRLLAELERDTTYYWRVKATAPVAGDWSAVSNFSVAELPAEAAPPIVIEQMPAPIINIPQAPAPIQPADIIIPAPVTVPAPIAPAYIWAVIIIGAVLVIAVIILIVRTRRTV